MFLQCDDDEMIDLRYRVFDEINFTNAVFEQCHFGRANFKNKTNLTEVVFENSTFYMTYFSTVILNNALFEGGTLKSSFFYEVEARDASFNVGTMSHCSFFNTHKPCDLSRSSFIEQNLEGTTFGLSTVTDTKFFEATGIREGHHETLRLGAAKFTPIRKKSARNIVDTKQEAVNKEGYVS